MEERKVYRNPFSDQSNSRVTASGFTESTNMTNSTLNPERQGNDSVHHESSFVSGITEKIQGLNYKKKDMVEPGDSVSQIAPNEMFMKSVAVNRHGECLYDDIIGGYTQTADEKLDELDAITQIPSVSGLPVIFMNARLNFLIHLHKPLQSILGDGDSYPAPDSLWKLTNFMSKQRGKDRKPHDQLLYHVIKTTIRHNKVRSNPFNLPLLEVGMILNDKLIYISFMQLYQEFQIEWFKSMKDIDAPIFHNKFNTFKQNSALKVTPRQSEYRRKSARSVFSSL